MFDLELCAHDDVVTIGNPVVRREPFDDADVLMDVLMRMAGRSCQFADDQVDPRDCWLPACGIGSERIFHAYRHANGKVGIDLQLTANVCCGGILRDGDIELADQVASNDKDAAIANAIEDVSVLFDSMHIGF